MFDQLKQQIHHYKTMRICTPVGEAYRKAVRKEIDGKLERLESFANKRGPNRVSEAIMKRVNEMKALLEAQNEQ